MNTNLLQQHAAFKKQATASSSKPTSKPTAKQSAPRTNEPSKKRFKPDTKSVANNPNTFKWLKTTVDRLRRRYQKERKPVSIDDLIKMTGLDLDPHEKAWLTNALKDNPKVLFEREKEKFSFKPSYPMHNKDDLLNILREHYDNGMGGIMELDVKECILKAEEVIAELKSENLLKCVTRSDKQVVIYYRDTSVECQLSEDFKELWNTISVKEISENDIENYLKRVGIATMEGYGLKKKNAMKKKPVKRKRNVKMLNSHLDSKMLKEFD